MDNYLLLSLGHNSSAIFVDNSNPQHQEIIGYEQERLSGIKADSQFPRDAINEIIKHISYDKQINCDVLISHWFNMNAVTDKPNKYITQEDYDWLSTTFGGEIILCGREFTHHDAHAYSAYEFFKYYKKDYNTCGNIFCLVVDGFGNNEEVLSLYKTDSIKGIQLIHRVYGYGASLGLMYQYATAFVGMKENQDEYKFLGYEAHIDEHFNEQQIDTIDNFIEMNKERLIKLFDTQTKKPEFMPENEIIDFDLLRVVRDKWNTIFSDVLASVDVKSITCFAARCAIAYFIQQVCERTLIAWLSKYDIDNLLVAGGVFYNVKLNQALEKNSTKKAFSVIPLAGDQGAPIGMYAKFCDRQFDFGNLCWGKRSFYNANKIIEQRYGKRNEFVKYCKLDDNNCEMIQNQISELISNGHIVNLVFGSMEFGPRALCHTSTLFLPTEENVHINNSMNGRNEVMPCAPVCTRENAYKLFDKDDLDNVIGSDNYMICTHTYKKKYSKMYGGIMHKRPLENAYTGRPQIVNEGEFMYNILKKIEETTDCKAIVNTSFNVHGRPIVFDIMDILHNYAYQCEHAYNEYKDDNSAKPYLYIIDTNK